jgi:hypothetical protein
VITGEKCQQTWKSLIVDNKLVQKMPSITHRRRERLTFILQACKRAYPSSVIDIRKHDRPNDQEQNNATTFE